MWPIDSIAVMLPWRVTSAVAACRAHSLPGIAHRSRVSLAGCTASDTREQCKGMRIPQHSERSVCAWYVQAGYAAPGVGASLESSYSYGFLVGAPAPGHHHAIASAAASISSA